MIQIPWIHKPPYGVKLNRQHPLAQGLVGCWLMNEGGGGTAFDLVDNLSFILNTFVTPIFTHEGLDFNGVDRDEAVILTDDRLNLGVGNFTLTIKFKTYSQLNQYVFSKNYGGEGIVWWAMTVNDGGVSFLVDDGTTFVSTVGSNRYDLADDKWHTVSVCRIGSNWRLFIDGADDTYNPVVNSYNLDNTGDVYLGNRADASTTRQFYGSTATAMLHKRVLTAGEITSLHTNPYQILEPLFIPSVVAQSGLLPINLTAELTMSGVLSMKKSYHRSLEGEI